MFIPYISSCREFLTSDRGRGPVLPSTHILRALKRHDLTTRVASKAVTSSLIEIYFVKTGSYTITIEVVALADLSFFFQETFWVNHAFSSRTSSLSKSAKFYGV